MDVHVVWAWSQKPWLMWRKSNFFSWITMILQNIHRNCQVSQIPNLYRFVYRSSYHLLLVFIEIKRQNFGLFLIIFLLNALWNLKYLVWVKYDPKVSINRHRLLRRILFMKKDAIELDCNSSCVQVKWRRFLQFMYFPNEQCHPCSQR